MKLEAQWAEPVSLIFLSVLRKLSTEHSIGAFYQISVHFGYLVSKEKFFFTKSTNQTQELPMMAMFANISGLNEQSL
jgi:hypothetical protein